MAEKFLDGCGMVGFGWLARALMHTHRRPLSDFTTSIVHLFFLELKKGMNSVGRYNARPGVACLVCEFVLFASYSWPTA